MGWSGYEQHLCKNGHQFTIDPREYMYSEEVIKCHCGAKSVWSNIVDETNGAGYPYSNFIEIAPEITETCTQCDHTKLVEEARYRTPTEEEMDKYKKELEEYYLNPPW